MTLLGEMLCLAGAVSLGVFVALVVFTLLFRWLLLLQL